MEPITAYELAQRDKVCLGLGCDVLDDFLRGGLRPGITEIAGASATGKTQFALQLLLQVQMPKQLNGLNRGAAFISTEGEFPMSRLRQMISTYKAQYPWSNEYNFLDNIFIENTTCFEEQKEALFERLPRLLTQQDIGLIVIDSIAAVFRVEFDNSELAERSKHLFQVAAHLKYLASTHNIPIVVINQVTDLFESKTGIGPAHHLRYWSVPNSVTSRVLPALGLSWAACVDCRLMLSRTKAKRAYSSKITVSSTPLSSAVAVATSSSSSVAPPTTSAPSQSEQASSTSSSKTTTTGIQYQSTERHLHIKYSPLAAPGICPFVVIQEGVRGVK